MAEKSMTLDDVRSFLKANWLKTGLRVVVSLAVVVTLLALYFVFAPRSERYSLEVQVTLESRGGSQYYPNGDRFSIRDIISSPVLNAIWKKYSLGTKGVKFEDFHQWFGIVSYDKERAMIDAEFQGKMTKRNITVTELTALQKEYEGKLAALSVNMFIVSMHPNISLDRETAVRLLGEIPEAWFSEYSRLKGPLIPSVASIDAIRAYVARIKDDDARSLELIDALRIYRKELVDTCNYIRNAIMKGRNAQVDGKDLGIYEAALQIFNSDLLRIKNKVLSTESVKGFGDFIAARLEDIACDRMGMDERVAAVCQSIDALDGGRKSVVEDRKSVTKGDGVPVTVQADAGFFADFAEMVRRSTNQDLMTKYIEELTMYRRHLADIKARELYYDQIMQHINKGNTNCLSKEELSKVKSDIESLVGNLIAIGEQIIVFRDRCFKVYRTSDQFYAVAASATYGRSFVLSLPRFGLGVLALWALFNLFFICRDWGRR